MASPAISVYGNVFLYVVALLVFVSTCEAHAYKGRALGGYTSPTLNFLSPDLKSEDEIGIFERYPNGAGPFPAAVVFHECGGLNIPRHSGWTAWFLRRGYAVSFVDNWVPRGISSSCPPTPGSRGTSRHRSQRAFHISLRYGDAWAAVLHIAGLPKVRSDRIVAIGFSHGGNVVFQSRAIFCGEFSWPTDNG